MSDPLADAAEGSNAGEPATAKHDKRCSDVGGNLNDEAMRPAIPDLDHGLDPGRLDQRDRLVGDGTALCRIAADVKGNQRRSVAGGDPASYRCCLA